jgi:hypothetical protein
MSGGEVARWVVLALLVVIGIGCYFWLAPRTRPIETPGVAGEP